MRDPIRTTVAALDLPSADERATALSLAGEAAAHDAAMEVWPCLNTIEVAPAPLGLPTPAALTVAAWNIERCKRVEASADLIRRSGADVVLATELDHGMVRSSQRHTARDLAGALGFGYAYAVEFVELGLGDMREMAEGAGQSNRHGLHGNAILSRYPLHDAALIPVAQTGTWFRATSPKGDAQARVGGRMAIAAQIETAAGPLTLAAVHYESESDASGRADQTRVLVQALDRLYGTGPAVIGGDLNTAALAGMTGAAVLSSPAAAEPSFAVFAQAGYDWRSANTGRVTTRAAPGLPVRYPLKTIDWLLVRGAAACDPQVWAAVCERGEYLSDHEMICARILP